MENEYVAKLQLLIPLASNSTSLLLSFAFSTRTSSTVKLFEETVTKEIPIATIRAKEEKNVGKKVKL